MFLFLALYKLVYLTNVFQSFKQTLQQTAATVFHTNRTAFPTNHIKALNANFIFKSMTQ